MKRLLCFFVLLIILCLFGCDVTSPPKVWGDFSSEATLSYQSISGKCCEAQIIVKGDFREGEGELFIATPDELSGLTFQSGGTFRTALYELSSQTEESRLTKFSPIKILMDCLCHLTQRGECKAREKEFWVFEGFLQGIHYKALVDKEGYVRNISSEELNFSVAFTYADKK